MPTPLIVRAARNNAEWCHAATMTSGKPGHFTEHYWFSPQPTASYLSNLVTLSPEAGATLLQLKAMIAEAPQQEWSTRDCFCTLDLTALGFHVALEGMWLQAPPDSLLPKPETENIRFYPVENATQLTDWGRAWAGGGECPDWCQPELLQNPDVTVFAGIERGRIVCGVIANRAAGVIGVSNIFVLSSNQIIACLRIVKDYFPDQTLIGYERLEAAAYYQSLGLETPGRMRTWVRDAV